MSTAAAKPATVQTEGKPNEFEASGDSPPPVPTSLSLVEELASILADALVADFEGAATGA